MTRPHTQTDLSALLGSRICHDLISPLGAIGNGLELLTLTGLNDDSPEFALMAQSVEAANARIRLFRIAFGQSSTGQTVPVSDLSDILDSGFANRRLRLTHSLPTVISRDEARIALLALLTVETALPLGGDLTLAQDGGVWTLTARAKRIGADPRLWASLDSGQTPAGLSPAEVQFALLPAAVAKAGRQLSVTRTETSLSLRF